MEYINKNLAAITALATFGGGFLSLYFIVIYLSKFSWSLVWLIEYTDIIKIAIVLVSFVISYVLLFYYWVIMCRWMKKKNLHVIIELIVYSMPVLSYLILTLFINYITGSRLSDYQISVIVLLMWTIWVALDIINAPPNISALSSLITPQMGLQIILILTHTANVMAQYTKYNDHLNSYIITEDRTYYNTRIIMLLSHHTIFLINDDIRVIKTDSIRDIVMYGWNNKKDIEKH